MTTSQLIDRGRASFARHAWTDAHDAFLAADRDAPLELEDLERVGLATHLIGNDDAAAELLGRAHNEAVQAGDLPRAVRIAFWIGMMLVQRGDLARGGGWLSRAARMAEDSGIDCVERGYVLIPGALRQLDSGDPVGAFATFERAAAIAERFGDRDLGALTRLGRGRALMGMSEVSRGVALLDEAMVAVTAGEVSPVVVGIVYCASIDAFQEIFDLRRAQEWTAALGAWCDSQPDLVPFRGRCLVYRAELLRLHGDWPEATEQARRAQDWLSRPPPEPAVGEAFYQQAELHRLRGEFREADVAYGEASQWGRRAEPGLALLRLAQGQASAASTIIRRAVDEASDDIARARLLEPAVEIALAIGDLDTARATADDLSRIADDTSAPLLRATAARAEGSVLLAEGQAKAALASLRRAFASWRELEAPYESARVRVQIGRALRQLGDMDTADLEFDAARRLFAGLGAAPDLVRVDAAVSGSVQRSDGLSGREVEVLRLLAAGMTNRAIAADLGISERTVDRHVSNVYTKLDVSTRSAATAYAYEHDLV